VKKTQGCRRRVHHRRQKPFYEATASVREKYGAPYADLIKRIEAVQ
jgi:hypothetical protein